MKEGVVAAFGHTQTVVVAVVVAVALAGQGLDRAKHIIPWCG